jgi:hypothetical protein
LIERVKELDARASQIEDQVGAATRTTEQRIAKFQNDLCFLKSELNDHGCPTGDAIVSAVEEQLGVRMAQLESRVNSTLAHYESLVHDSLHQTENFLSETRLELAPLKHDLENRQTLSANSPVPRALQEILCSKARELEEKLLAQLKQIENSTLENPSVNEALATLHTELGSVKEAVRSIELSDESSMRAGRSAIDRTIQDLQQCFLKKLAELEEKALGQHQWMEHTVQNVETRLDELRAELSQARTSLAADPSLRALDEQLTAKIEELRIETTKRFANREVDLKELKAQSESLTLHVLQLGGTMQTGLNASAIAGQTTPEAMQAKGAPAPVYNAKPEEHFSVTHAASEKEQLITLQERMSAEIERVRAELKERSGRWKVRKTGS